MSDALDPAYPPAPWPLSGQLWLSLFRVPRPVDQLRPEGLYGAAFVSYEEPSPLTYSELLVARAVRGRVSITDIWVDSPASMAGGRELWAIPKGLADFTLDTAPRRTTTSRWSATLDGGPVATATFRDVSHRAPRTPFRAGIRQPGLDGGRTGRATMQGRARSLPCGASWHFDRDGPLGWLAGHRPLLSVRMSDFAMSFG